MRKNLKELTDLRKFTTLVTSHRDTAYSHYLSLMIKLHKLHTATVGVLVKETATVVAWFHSREGQVGAASQALSRGDGPRHSLLASAQYRKYKRFDFFDHTLQPSSPCTASQFINGK